MLELPVAKIAFIKKHFTAVVRLHMTDDETVKLVWEVMELEQKFEDDPYSLSLEEIEILQHNEKYRVR